jgi:hypothetical protein
MYFACRKPYRSMTAIKPLKKQFFMHIKSNTYKRTKNYKIASKRLFHGNAMRPKGAYFAQANGIHGGATAVFRFNQAAGSSPLSLAVYSKV